MEETGKITNKDIKNGYGKKAWTRIAYTINGKVFSTFESKFGSYNTGDTIKVEFDKSPDGKFNNIHNITGIEVFEQKSDFNQSPLNISVEKIEDATVWEKKDLRNAKMNSLNNANSILNTIALVAPQYLVEAFEKTSPFEYLKQEAKKLIEFIYE